MWEGWTPYTRAEADALVATNAPITASPGERRCPVCGKVAVRYYYYETDDRRSPVGILYVWCANSHHYTSSRGAPLSATHTFPDPYANTPLSTRVTLERDPHWLDTLNTLWTEGTLPQTFTPRS